MDTSENEMQCLQDDKVFVKTEEDDIHPWYDIDTGMLSSKLSYFFQNAKDSCYLPYMILFLSGIGLTDQQAGTINGLRFIGFIFGAPLWGILADYKHQHTAVILLLCVTSLILMTSQPFISIPLSANNTCLNVDGGNVTSVNKTTYLVRNVTATKIPKKESDGNGGLFAAMMALNLLISVFDGSTQGFVDAGVIQKMSSRSSRKSMFGTQRLFGAFGYGTGAFASSLAIEYGTVSGLPCYTPVFVVYGIFVLGLTASTYNLFNSLTFAPANTPSGRKARSLSVTSDVYREHVSVGRALKSTLCKFRVVFFLVTVLVVGTIHAVYISFLFVLLKEINCPNVVMGLSIVVGALASVIGIKLSEDFINGFGGTIRVLCLGCFSWAVRFLSFTYLRNPWIVLPIQLLQGFGYGLFIAVSVVHIKRISSPDIYTSMYGIFNGLFFGAGAVIGNVIGGAVLMRFGVRILCFGTSMAGFLWTAVMILYLTVGHCTGAHM